MTAVLTGTETVDWRRGRDGCNFHGMDDGDDDDDDDDYEYEEIEERNGE